MMAGVRLPALLWLISGKGCSPFLTPFVRPVPRPTAPHGLSQTPTPANAGCEISQLGFSESRTTNYKAIECEPSFGLERNAK